MDLQNNVGDRNLPHQHARFRHELNNFFFFYSTYLRSIIYNDIDQNIELQMTLREYSYNSDGIIMYKVFFGINDHVDNREPVLRFRFQFNLPQLTNTAEPIGNARFWPMFARVKVFEALLEKSEHQAQYKFKTISNVNIDTLSRARWSLAQNYNLDPETRMPSTDYDLYQTILNPTRTALLMCIESFTIHDLGRNDDWNNGPLNGLDGRLQIVEGKMAPQLWNAIGRITEMAEHVINKKLESQN
jgi:hypothetical protein